MYNCTLHKIVKRTVYMLTVRTTIPNALFHHSIAGQFLFVSNCHGGGVDDVECMSFHALARS